MTTQARVLVVDDDPVVARSIDRVLSAKGYAVITAADGPEALDKLARGLSPEEVGAVLGAVERVSGGLVDRHRHRVGGRLGPVTGVHGLGLEMPVG